MVSGCSERPLPRSASFSTRRSASSRLDTLADAAEPFLEAAKPVAADLRPFASEMSIALPEWHAATQRLDPMTNALLPYLPDVAAFTVQTRSIVSLEDSNNGVLRATAPYSFQTPPPVLGTNNGVKPLPAGPPSGPSVGLPAGN